MRYISLLLLIPALFSVAHAQGTMQAIGTPGIGQPNIVSCNTNGAGDYCAVEFVPLGSHTLSTISLQIVSITGSLGRTTSNSTYTPTPVPSCQMLR